MQKHYDAIVVLGSQPDYRTWQFPSHTYASLDKAAELIGEGVSTHVALSGDHAIKYDHTGITQPFKEADKMEEYLLAKGLPSDAILKENVSRDTVANFYYLKNLVFKPHGIRSVLLITTDFRIERFKFLWQKVMGPDYSLDFATVPYAAENVYKNEAITLKRQQDWLKDVADGDDAWFADKFYGASYYQAAKARDEARLTANIDFEEKYLI